MYMLDSNTKTLHKRRAMYSTRGGTQRDQYTASYRPSPISGKLVVGSTREKAVSEVGSVISFTERSRVQNWSVSWNWERRNGCEREEETIGANHEVLRRSQQGGVADLKRHRCQNIHEEYS